MGSAYDYMYAEYRLSARMCSVGPAGAWMRLIRSGRREPTGSDISPFAKQDERASVRVKARTPLATGIERGAGFRVSFCICCRA